ncbi:rhodanese-like domain-containing protein [Mycolicibacterium sp. BiH015]|uniref:rhodanese-like domain-containing protein n=1 Tax=Mycolicibacterium sp. BiH015 TaxID=3018808 RepID=UPI0022E67A6F|nr:rhodanese-like domain-containing protein [Mycolicibacterium sp. BiH015]MDA2892517.1 rhodanese-like domain-containing protein [Mycolicibacterium sp. BiH015]
MTVIDAHAFFAAKLAYEIDAADLAAARTSGRGPIVVDTRSAAAWEQGHLPGALHIPGGELCACAADELPDRDADIVVYCWGPGCNGATKAAFTLSGMGYRRVRELIGGFEYWAREGLSVVTANGRTRRMPDSLTAVIPNDFPARVRA